ncbi:MAG: Gldg family protein, partial [Planctomycetota bacterium]|nr:Gldg family protein [Planctomycetota bacterium]
MIGALRTTWRQASAICLAEWLRMLTTPAWAALLILWTLVCGLFFQVVVTHAAHNELPIGETPLTAFFRFFPGLLPVLLIVFVPQLSMDLLAGRRESGRLEQLQLAGVQPLALILGGYVAVCSVLVVLAVPILLFHGVLAGATNADPGATLGGIFALLIQSAVLAALSVAVGAWAPTRLAASLTACALGLIWWIFDLFAPAIAGAEAMGSPWHRALALADTVHDFAGGLIEWRPVVASVVLVLSLLALARLGLLWRIRPGPRLLSVATVLLATLAALTLSTRVTTTSDITWSGSHGISEHSIAVVKALAEEAPVTVTLIATPGMRNDPADGPLLSGVRTLLQRLAPHGVDFQLLDPERSPKAVVALRDRLHIADRDLQRPVLVAEHLNRAAVLPAARLGAVATGNGRRTLARLDAESALVAELQRLHGELPTVAWLTCPELRVIETPLPHRRAEAVGAWRRQLSAEGFAVEELADWSGLSAGEFDLAVVAGPQTTLPSEAVNELRQHLLRGGHLLLALDAEAGSQNELRAALANYGVGWGAGYLT